MNGKSSSPRYSRHVRLEQIGEAGQEKFAKAKVLVIGAGGLGCPALQYLAAAGVGTIGIVDFDVVDESNLQRQILFTTPDIGKPKAECARRTLLAQNPGIEVVCYPYRLNPKNAIELISGYDLVLDGSDNFETRYLVNDACIIAGKPFVFGSIYKFEGQLTVFNYQDGPTYRCLYPEPNDLGSCAEVGVLGVLPGTIGCGMATEALKIISGAGDVLSGRLLVYDALKPAFTEFRFRAVESNKQIKSIQPFQPVCNTPAPELSVAEFKLKMERKEKFLLVDVRERNEYASQNLSGVNIPLSELQSSYKTLPQDIPLVIHCKSGTRSLKAVEILFEKGYRDIYSLKGGIDEFIRLS